MKKIFIFSMLLFLNVIILPETGICFDGEIAPELKTLQTERRWSGDQDAQPDNSPRVLSINDRIIAVIRAPLFGRSPKIRVESFEKRIPKVISENLDKEITTKEIPEGITIFIGNESLLTIQPSDLAPAFGEDKKTVVDRAIKNLNIIKKEIADSRSIKFILRSAGYCLIATVVFAFALFIFLKLYGMLMHKFEGWEAYLTGKIKIADINFFQNVIPVIRWITRIANWTIVIFGTYLWLTFCLSQFPQTRALSNSLGGYLVDILRNFSDEFLAAIPDFFAIIIIIMVFRILSKMIDSFFTSVETGSVKVSWIHPEVVRPTSRIAHGILWIFGLIMVYPYLPGSGSDAFKGVSVMVGVILSLGSTSIINQAAAGMVLMYSRAFRAGEFISFDDMEGRVISLGILSTKIRAASREEVTIPNAVLSNAKLKNYSRFKEGSGVILSTTVTIGYSTPWRKIHELLILAARRTPDIIEQPEPFVRQRSLSDFYVEYQLVVVTDKTEARAVVMSALHANIQDLFNESGEQILSPHYEADPPEKVWVPKERWFERPVVPEDAESITETA